MSVGICEWINYFQLACIKLLSDNNSFKHIYVMTIWFIERDFDQKSMVDWNIEYLCTAMILNGTWIVACILNSSYWSFSLLQKISLSFVDANTQGVYFVGLIVLSINDQDKYNTVVSLMVDGIVRNNAIYEFWMVWAL